MNECFADTFVFLAMLNRQDRKHAAAIATLNATRVPLVTTAWVLTELADGLCSVKSRSVFVTLESNLRKNSQFTILPASSGLYEDGLDLYRKRVDKDWSLTDCISFIAMRNRGISAALTGDHHFEQAGFVALLK